MVFPYYFFVWTYMRIPSLSEYIQMYFAVYCNECEDGKFTFKEEVDNSGITFTKEQLIGRVSRSYNSFTREIHLLLLLREKFHANVGYDLKWDLNGVDLLVKVGGKYVGIATYVESARSNNYKQRKNTVRHDYSKIRMVDMRAELKEAESSTYSVHNVKLYRPEYVARVYQNQICAA